MTSYIICDLCGGIEDPDCLTPIHTSKDGQLFTLFFHNRKRNDCLGRKITDLQSLFDMFGQNVPEISSYFGGD